MVHTSRKEPSLGEEINTKLTSSTAGRGFESKVTFAEVTLGRYHWIYQGKLMGGHCLKPQNEHTSKLQEIITNKIILILII